MWAWRPLGGSEAVSRTVSTGPPRYPPHARCQARRLEAQGQEVAETHAPRSCASKLARDSRLESFAEGRPNVLDIILNKQVNLIINTPWAKRDAIKDDKC